MQAAEEIAKGFGRRAFLREADEFVREKRYAAGEEGA
jgi:hypothetical protein